jgi:hypothetical protein
LHLCVSAQLHDTFSLQKAMTEKCENTVL